MRPSTKHGLEKKFKPWRKGKASSDKASGKSSGSASGNGSVKRPTNASLKNRLRGQKRLLAKLQQNDGDAVKNKETIDGVQQSMKQLERDIAAYETSELEKKNATKYHQVKFIERQKLTRLEKSVKRQLQNLKQSNKEENENEQQTTKQISNVEHELQSIAMNQLYIAFYPTDMKYMALFTNGNNRVVDDERGQKRRMAAWNKIREGLLQESKQNDDSDNKDDKDNNGRTKMQLNNAKTWVNLDAAKKALLSMPADTYPDAPSADNAGVAATSSSALVKNKPKNKASKKESAAAATTEKKGKAQATASDSRFANSKDLEGLFGESTTGDDYQQALKSKESSDESDSDDSDADSSSDDNADPLKALKGSKKLQSSSVNNAKQNDGSSSSSSSSAPSSSSSEDSSDSDSDSSDSDSDTVESPLKNNQVKLEPHTVQEKEDADDGDDFFTTDKVSTEDIFTQVAKNNQKKKNSNHFDDEMPSQKPKGDKSRGFKSQNQSKKEYSDFQHRQKRQKFI